MIDPSSVTVLVGCERSKAVRNAFLMLGFDAYSCDLQEAVDGNDNRHIQDDIRYVMRHEQWDLLTVMHPPCTRLCNSGVHWLTGRRTPKGKTKADMWRELDEGAALFSDCWNVPNIKHVAVENPVMHRYAKQRIRNFEPAAQHVQPHQFGDPFFKLTGFYLRDLPKLEPVNAIVDVPNKKIDPVRHAKWSAVHRCPPGEQRANIRSRTFPGIANAIADQWGRHVLEAAAT